MNAPKIEKEYQLLNNENLEPETVDHLTSRLVDMLDNSPDYCYHHIASRRGYLSRKHASRVVPYSGRFGKGYAVLSPRWDTSQYIWVTYYIQNN